MARKSKNMADDGLVPALKPHDPEIAVLGDEPGFHSQPLPHERSLRIIKSLNWYNRFYDLKMARDIMRDYLKHQGQADAAAIISRVPDSEFSGSICWLARLSLRGLQLTSDESQRIDTEIARLLSLVAPVEKNTEPKSRVNIQEIMREKAQAVAGDIEGLFDDFIASAAKNPPETLDVMRLLHDQNIMPQHITLISEHWRNRKSEFESIATDRELAEGYGNFSKTQIKGVIKFCDSVLSELGGYVTVKKATKAPRKRKAIPPEKQASKLQYMKTCDDPKLTSVPPAKIIGASEVWAYDVAKRKLWYFIADAHAGSLSIKGTTILGFDSAASGMKVLRKPQEQLREFMSAGKPASRKFFKDLKSVQAQLKGRTNENLIILKVY